MIKINNLKTNLILFSSLLLFPLNQTVAQQVECDERQTLCNPLKSTTLLEFIDSLLGALTLIVIPLLVFAIIYSGFRLVFSRGNKDELDKAKKGLLAAIIGTVVVLSARVIIGIIEATISAL